MKKLLKIASVLGIAFVVPCAVNKEVSYSALITEATGNVLYGALVGLSVLVLVLYLSFGNGDNV